MSRDVDPNAKNLSDDDKLYLAQRGQLPTDVMSVEDQRKLLDPSGAGPSVLELGNTGTVATMTTDELEAELERRRAEVVDPKKLADLMTNPGGLKGAEADEEDEDDGPLEAPYDQYSKAKLSAELARRNEERDEDDQLALSGNKQELVDRLDEDDASEDDEEE